MKLVDRMLKSRFPLQRRWAALRTKYLLSYVFVHINKTGGSSIERALGMPFQHLTARELQELLGPERWFRRFSFGFVRNPWDRVVSHYHYRVKTNQTGLGVETIPFEEWVVRAYGEREPRYYDQPKMFMPQCEWLADASGEVAVDFVGRFERLHDDFRVVCGRIGVKAELPHLKRSGHRDYRELYSPETRDLVGRLFAGDVETFGYDFA